MQVHVLSLDPLLEKNFNVKTPVFFKIPRTESTGPGSVQNDANSGLLPQKVNSSSTVNKSISPSSKPNRVIEEKGKNSIRNKKSLKAINIFKCG